MYTSFLTEYHFLKQTVTVTSSAQPSFWNTTSASKEFPTRNTYDTSSTLCTHAGTSGPFRCLSFELSLLSPQWVSTYDKTTRFSITKNIK